MKILIHSNAPWCATGYGQQTAQLAKRLQADGHDVAISAFYGLQGAQLDWNGLKVYPMFLEQYGADVLIAHAEDHFGGEITDGLIITLVDAWVLPALQLREANVLMWTPVDHEPAPEKVVEAIRNSGATPVAMSRHGERMLKDAGLEPVYAPHGIDTEVMCPKDKNEWRQMIKPEIPEDWFVCGMVAANKGNPSRKGFEIAFQAFAKFNKKQPKSLLYIHSEATGAINGVDLIELSKACGIAPENIRFSPQYHSVILGLRPEFVANIISSFDVLINVAYGEGFGIPVVEAQACGVPVIVTDWTAMSELCGAGWKVEGQKTYTIQRSWSKAASVHETALALDKAHSGAKQLKNKARTFALQYDADTVYDTYWKPILADVEAKFADRQVVEPAVEVIAA